MVFLLHSGKIVIASNNIFILPLDKEKNTYFKGNIKIFYLLVFLFILTVLGLANNNEYIE